MKMQILEMSSQLVTYLTMAVVGLIVVAWSVIFGGHDGDHDHDSGADHGADHGAEPTVSMFSPKVIAAFVLGFGAAGAIATIYGEGVLVSVLWGGGGGILMGAIALYVMRFLYGQQSSSTLHDGEAVGKTGRISTAVPEGGVGEVEVSIRGASHTFSARATSGAALKSGSLVKVERDVGGTLFVGPI